MQTHSFDNERDYKHTQPPSTNRKQHLEMEISGWFDQLTTHEETPAQPSPLNNTLEVTPRSQLQDEPQASAKTSANLLNKLGKLFGRHEVA